MNAVTRTDEPGKTPPCARCHGVGTMLISLCCGRGCTNCVGDGFREIECPRCNGSGLLSPSTTADFVSKY